MTSRFAACGVFLLLCLWGANVFACSCERSINPVKGSKMVFWGKVTEIKPRGAQDRVSFQIDYLYKGDDQKMKALVYTNRFNHDCGFRFEVDKTYMVYAYDFYPRGVATSSCWGTYEAAEPVADEKWTDVKVVVPPDTKLEEELRKVAKKVVPTCGAKFRLFDGGFSMVLSPDGDPARPIATGDRASQKLENFRNCVAEGFLRDDDLPKPDRPVQIQGWYQRDVKQQPVLLDELPCAEGCEDWVMRVKGGLMDLDGPEEADSVAANLRAERESCIKGGISAVGGESPGGPTAKKRRDRMLAECAMERGEFEQAEPYMEEVGDATLVAAFKWALARAKAKPEGAPKYPLGDGKPTFAAELTQGKSSKAQKESAGKFRVLRRGFVDDPHWTMSPAYLEAFAESILADGSAPAPMHDLASLAYERAGLFMPAASEAYKALADKASSSDAAKEMRAQLTAAHAAANAPPVEEVVEEVPEEAVPVMEEEPEAEKDPMLLVVAGVLILVAVAGIGAILKRRR